MCNLGIIKASHPISVHVCIIMLVVMTLNLKSALKSKYGKDCNTYYLIDNFSCRLFIRVVVRLVLFGVIYKET